MSSQRQFALEIVQRLRDAGYQALWAGGCVRDGLLDLPPKDYDVATSARPEEIRAVFGVRRTLAIGAAFGVITVLGNKTQGQIDVATFRQDAGYSDGRHPDSITFSTPEQDAQRRDFTINGLFFDPLEDRVIDYVGGVDDLHALRIRAIGDPDARINEDKLRMLRAVRFAATYGFTIEAATFAAVQRHAPEIKAVSAERIAAEMRRMLKHASRARAVELLLESKLLAEILPEGIEAAACATTRALLDTLHEPSFPVALAALLWPLGEARVEIAKRIAQRWRLSNEEQELCAWVLTHEVEVRQAEQLPWPQLQRLLIHESIDELLQFVEAIGRTVDGTTAAFDFCQHALSLPPAELNPPPLITGDDLKRHGIPPGKIYQRLLTEVRDAQLEKRIATQAEALALAESLWRTRS